MRAADSDRQRVAEALQTALNEGRLTLDEYDERLRDAYAARTYGELDRLLDDIPGTRPTEHSQVIPATKVSQPTMTSTRPWAVWGSWVGVAVLTVGIWAVASIASGEFLYFWPIWVIGPWGAVLLFRTISWPTHGVPHGRARGHRDRRRRYRD
jgi:hypothetical protein